jgi:TIR domain
MEIPKTFFSYSRADAEFALKLAKDLRDAGANVWLDQLDIAPGLRWDAEIEKALHAAQNMLVILSAKAIASNNVMDEISFALEEGKRVIPILVSECTIPFRIKRLQHIDFSKNYDDGINQLLKALELNKPKPPEPIKADTEVNLNPKTDNEENLLWVQVEKEQSIQGFWSYIKEYPNGKYKHEALFGIKFLEKIILDKRNKEEDLWNRCCNINTIESYKEYLKQTESGTYKTQANKFIQQLESNREPVIAKTDETNSAPVAAAYTLDQTENKDNKLWLFILGGVGLLLLIISIINGSSSSGDTSTTYFDTTAAAADSIAMPAADSTAKPIFSDTSTPSVDYRIDSTK